MQSSSDEGVERVNANGIEANADALRPSVEDDIDAAVLQQALCVFDAAHQQKLSGANTKGGLRKLSSYEGHKLVGL